MKTIVIDISPSGTTTIDAKCFTGSNCASATEEIEIVLGGKGEKKRKKKPEYFQSTGGKQKAKLTF